MRRLALLALLAVPAASFAQQDLFGISQFPQFRSISGLPGGGFGLNRRGLPDFKGAMSLSTPIAYSLGPGNFAIVGGNTSSDSSPRFLDRAAERRNRGNGTAAGMAGIGTPVGNLTASFMVLSTVRDSVFNFQFQPRLETEKFDIGIGIQDAFNTGGEHGEPFDNLRPTNSRSLYIVATYEAAEETFVSLGTGTQRFKDVWGNASFRIVPRLKGLIEYDRFNWNYGIAGDLGKWRLGFFANRDIDVQTTAYIGMVRGKYFTWSLSFSF